MEFYALTSLEPIF